MVTVFQPHSSFQCVISLWYGIRREVLTITRKFVKFIWFFKNKFHSFIQLFVSRCFHKMYRSLTLCIYVSIVDGDVFYIYYIFCHLLQTALMNLYFTSSHQDEHLNSTNIYRANTLSDTFTLQHHRSAAWRLWEGVEIKSDLVLVRKAVDLYTLAMEVLHRLSIQCSCAHTHPFISFHHSHHLVIWM